MNKKFYITTAIPYVNARPHIGHALEFIQADVIARYHRLKGEEVLLLSGSDENALKNVQAAQSAGVPVQQFIDENAVLFVELANALGVQFDVFQKGSSKEHHLSSQKLWQLCAENGDIYKKSYEGLYCTGCEAFYTPDELDANQECLEHPGRKLESVSEENYFFKLSRYQDKIISVLESDELEIVPATRKNEMLAFLKQTLQDISISRTNERAKNWGVPVPADDSQRMYVWFDALNMYQSGVGFGLDEQKHNKWWPADIHVIGKGIIRFHAVYWPAFLLSAGLPLPKKIFVHGYITSSGQKMSKTLGNVVDPFPLVEKYGSGAVRYFFLREIPPTEDGDFSYEKFEERYNSDLASGLGNLVARVLALVGKINPKSFDKLRIPSEVEGQIQSPKLREIINAAREKVDTALEKFQFQDALIAIWDVIHFCDRYIEEKKPWSFDFAQDKPDQKEVIDDLLLAILAIGTLLKPFLPATSEKIANQLQHGKGDPLFPRLDRNV
ncbi:MAG: methionine--tRNA ligase [Candidatus Wildermuthbacteria bacterium]|nr:methionine--tRNA ligase [Candidatus Wildermuthbacteria bacterium]